MSRFRVPSVLGLTLLLISGCVGDSPPKATDEATETTTTVPMAEFGSIAGVVYDDEGRPLSGVQVEVVGENLTATSAASGDYQIDNVPIGPQSLEANATGFEGVSKDVTVTAGATATLDLILVAVPTDEFYFRTVELEGHYDCANEIPIWTEDCLILYEEATGQEDDVTSEKNAFVSDLVTEGWGAVLAELVWEKPANNQLDGMRLYVEETNLTNEGHGWKLGRADGPDSPLRVLINRGEPGPRADVYTGTDTYALISDEGEDVLIRVFGRGHLYEYTSQVCEDQENQQKCLLGLGVGLDIRFTVYFTVFFHGEAPADFTAIPPA